MNKKVHLEVIRILAIILVVFNHTDGYFSFFANTDNPFTYFVSLFFSVLCRINVPLFFMVTGALLIPQEEEIREVFKKRVFRIFAVIIIFSMLHYIANGLSGKLTGKMSLTDFLITIMTGTVIESYWFLYSYLAVLIMIPFLRKMAKGMNGNEFRYLFILKMIFDIVFRILLIFADLGINLELFIIVDPIFYVLFGYYMECIVPREKFERKYIGKIVLLSLGVITACMAATVMDYKINGMYSQSCLGIFNPILVILIFYIVKAYCTQYKLPEKVKKAIIYLGSTVFGIYLIEQLVRRQLLPMYLYLCDHTFGIFACFCYVVTTIILSVFYVSILKKVPGINKLI